LYPKDFWDTLSSLVYVKGWKAENVQQLERESNFALNKLTLKVEKRLFRV
jgi:hypothetical protein